MTAALAVPTTGTHALDPLRSSIAFTTRHMFGAGKVTGTFALSGGSVTVAEPTSVRAQAPAASFSTGSAKRDTHVLSADFLDAEAYPSIWFRSTEVRQLDGRWIVVGELTVRGVAAPVEFTVTGTERATDGLIVTATVAS